MNKPVRLEFAIRGMHCAACSSRIERVVGGLPDVAVVGVSLATDTASVLLAGTAETETAAERIIAAIKRLGFEAERVDSSPGNSGAAEADAFELAIGGMHCAACSARIERILSAIPRISSASVSLATNTAHITARPGADVSAIRQEAIAAITGLGFSAEVIERTNGSVYDAARRWDQRRAEQVEDLAARRRDLIPAFAFALPLLVLSMGEMAGMPLPEAVDPRFHPFTFALLQLVLCLPVLWSGRRFFFYGLPALARRAPNMDSLVALGTGAAFLFSLWTTFTAAALAPAGAHGSEAAAQGLWDMFFGASHAAHGVDLYYESAAVVIALVSLGKYLESRSRLSTSEALKGLLDLSPESALRILQDGSREEVPLDQIRQGDTLFIRPGSRVPVDGTVRGGNSFVDESMLTGESMPVEKKPGDSLAGGTMNQQGALTMTALHVGADTMLARIVRLVQEAQGSKAPIAGMADRVSYYFVPVVMVIAIVSGGLWWLLGDSASFALRIFVSVLVIACPCAMGLATPMAIMVGTGRGAQLGVLFKNGQALEQSSRITAIVFDKTGTLTSGRPALVDIETLANYSADELLVIAAALEHSSEHPLAAAIVTAAQQKSLEIPPVEDFQATPGKGVSGRLEQNGVQLTAAVGNAVFVKDLMRAKDADTGEGGAWSALESRLERFSQQGKTPMVLLLDGSPAAILAVADPLRPETPATVAAIKKMGITCIMLTGDTETTARAVAFDAGIDEVIAGVLPDGKEQAVSALQAKKHIVGMVGDGINDAPALARADVGFAVKSGIDIAVETGDVVLMRNGVETITTALSLGRAVMRNIRENLFWAFAYNIVGIPFAAGLFYLFGGPVLSPMLAGAAMALSSVSVVGNSLRLRFFAAK